MRTETGRKIPVDVAIIGIDMENAGAHGNKERIARNYPADIKKNELKPWRVQEWCIPPEKNAEFVAAMEDILDVYCRKQDKKRPLVWMNLHSN
jgi:hypothetical protein